VGKFFDMASPGGDGSLGLVSSQTSKTPDGVIELSCHENRIRRLRAAVNAGAVQVENRTKRPGFRPPKAALLTLTYRESVEWSPRHISPLLNLIQKWARRRGYEIPYVWVAELTKRGRMHYHVMLWLPRGVTIPKPDKQGWWPYGHTRIEWARSAVGYLCKYASKGTGEDHTFPKGARVHGAGGLTSVERRNRRWATAPAWVQDYWQPDADVHRAPGGGWYSRETGEHQESPWEVLGFSGTSVWLTLKRRVSTGLVTTGLLA